MRKVTINGEFEIILPEHRADREQWYSEEGWEKARLKSMHEHLSTDDVLFYVGAEEGDMAALCAMWGAKVGLFEPNDKVWSNIKAIFEANNVEPLFSYNGFASNKNEGLHNIYNQTFPPSSLGELISDHGFKELHEPGEITQIKIDDFVMMSKYIPDAITLDVEGSEWEVLKGAERTLVEHKPILWVSIHPEFMFRIYEQYQFDLRYWIKSFGYKETILDYQHELHLFYE